MCIPCQKSANFSTTQKEVQRRRQQQGQRDMFIHQKKNICNRIVCVHKIMKTIDGQEEVSYLRPGVIDCSDKESSNYCNTSTSERRCYRRSLVSQLLQARRESLLLECQNNNLNEEGRNIIVMSSAIYSTDILSSEFYSLYDQLEYDASSLETSTESLKQAKLKRDETQVRLRNSQIQLTKTRSFIKEQKYRINLVSTHWFYGTTLLQPQLWLRGGCQGKIQRAITKLEKAQDHDLPQLLANVTTLQEIEIPRAQADVEDHLARFDLSANAASGREVMRQRVFAEYPSQRLIQLQQEEESLERKIGNIEREIDNLDNDVIPKLIEGQQCYHKAKKLLEESIRRNDKFQQLEANPVTTPSPADVLRSPRDHRSSTRYSETRVPNGTRIVTIDRPNNGERDIVHVDRQGNIISTNFPCPNQCGFLITGHATHCCQACKNRGGNHGPRCQRRIVASQQCAQTKLNNLTSRYQAYQSDLSRENDACNRALTSARKEAKQGERLIRQALSNIAVTIRERYVVVCNELHYRPTTATEAAGFGFSPTGGGYCPCSQVRGANINTELTDVVERQLLVLTGQLSSVEQLLSTIQQDGEDTQHRIQSTRSMLETEQDRIFLKLRERVLFGYDISSSSSNNNNNNNNNTPVPEADGESYYERPPAFAPHASTTATATPVVIPSAPVEDEDSAPTINDTNDDVPIVAATLVVE